MSDFLLAVLKFAVVVFVEALATLLGLLLGCLLFFGPVAGAAYAWRKGTAAVDKWSRKQVERDAAAAWDELERLKAATAKCEGEVAAEAKAK